MIGSGQPVRAAAQRWHCLALLLLALWLGASTAAADDTVQAAEAEGVDPAVVGTWEMPVPLGQFTGRWIWEINADGTYSFQTDPPNIIQSHQGRVGFGQGRWWQQASAGLPGWTDGGTYQMNGPDMLLATGQLGTGLWRRSGGTAEPSGGASAPAWPDTVPAMAATALEKARAWRADAELIEVDVETTPDSFRQAIPQGDYSFTFIFWSPSDQGRLLITPFNPAGEVFEGGPADHSADLPIPEKFLDFLEASAQAQAMGMSGQPERATLTNAAWKDPAVSLVWTIWPVNATGIYEVVAWLGAPPPPSTGD
jgi:hypothetical protein